MSSSTEETMKASEVRNNWSQVIKNVFTTNSLVILEKSCLTVGAIVGPQDLQILRAHREKIARRKKLLEGMWQKFEDVPEGEIEREIEKARIEIWEEENKKQHQS